MFKKLKNGFHNKCIDLMIRFTVYRSKPKQLSLKNCWNDVSNCLLFWPGEGLDVKAAEIIMLHLSKRFSDAKLTVVTLPGIGVSLPRDIKARIIEIDRNSLNIFGLPVKILKDEILDVRADVVVDLSSRYNPLASYLCLISRARVGVSFADVRSDSAFNFQIAPDPTREGIDRYRVMANYIG